VLTDAGAIRGQKNQDYWAAFMSGRTPPEPRIPFVYNKFFEQLRSAGINPVRNGPRVQIMALTGKDIDSLAEGREIQSAETVDWKEGLKPIKGGLFDETLTGGHNGNRWSYIKLHEPMPSPVMEEPIRRVLGLTQQKFMDVLGGKEKIGEESGPEAIGNALKRINLPEAVKRAETEWRGSKRSTKDAALKRWALLKHTEKLGLHPSEWMLDKIPVLPPAFRPVSVMGASGKPLVSDPNYLYKEAFDANQALKETSSFSRELADERTSLYKAFKGVTGLGDPVTPKNQESNVKGVLKYIFGDNPKFSVMQRKLLSTTVDVVGRGVISPNPNLDMDQVGLPESKAWEIYRPFIIRRLARRGIPALRAAEMVEKKDKVAKDAMQQELNDRPVIITRAPVLHRYGVMAFRPQLIKAETLQISPAIVKGFGADFDGDTMNYHVPVSEGAVKDALEKMLPSKNLLSTKTFRAHQLPQNEYQGGLYHATAFVSNKPERYFATKADAIKAYKSGEIGSDQKVVILN
jgi:DNA-directed RNA polymerase subunit beta'